MTQSLLAVIPKTVPDAKRALAAFERDVVDARAPLPARNGIR
jgi:hypothetical protein